MNILTIGPNKGIRIYKSQRAASRALSGTGSDGLQSTIHRRVTAGGGFVGKVWVESTNFPSDNSIKK